MTAVQIRDDQSSSATHIGSVVAPPQPKAPPAPTALAAAVDTSQQSPKERPSPTADSATADALLLIYADALDDLEGTRIATQNRVRSLQQVKGMAGTPEEARLQVLVDGIAALEHGAELELKRALRTHPLGPWVKRTAGIGEKQGARLLAAIGDPASRRTVSQLWAYCGYHVLPASQLRTEAQRTNAGGGLSSDPAHAASETQRTSGGVAPSHTRGHFSNWNDTARKRAFLVAESCMKTPTSPYRKVYEDGRAKYADSTHAHDCRRCGPSGSPAEIGSPLSAGHQHARALRLVAKAVLRDLWIEAKAVAA